MSTVKSCLTKDKLFRTLDRPRPPLICVWRKRTKTADSSASLMSIARIICLIRRWTITIKVKTVKRQDHWKERGLYRFSSQSQELHWSNAITFVKTQIHVLEFTTKKMCKIVTRPIWNICQQIQGLLMIRIRCILIISKMWSKQLAPVSILDLTHRKVILPTV